MLDLREARFRLTELRAVARHIVAFRAGDTKGERAAWAELARATKRKPPNLRQSRQWFQAALNRGLSPFRFYVRAGLVTTLR